MPPPHHDGSSPAPPRLPATHHRGRIGSSNGNGWDHLSTPASGIIAQPPPPPPGRHHPDTRMRHPLPPQRAASSPSRPRLLLAVTTLTLGCAILFLPSVTLSHRAHRRLAAAATAGAAVDETVHSTSIRSARDRMRTAVAGRAALNKVHNSNEEEEQGHRSLQRSSAEEGAPMAQRAASILGDAASNVADAAADANRARSAAAGRKLVSTPAAESHLDGSDGRRLGLGSALSDAAASAGIPGSVVGTIGSALSLLAGAASGVRNIARERQLAEVWDSPTLYDTPTFWHVPKAGGTAVIRYYARCRGLVEARGGKADGADAVAVTENAETGNKFVNVDTSSPDGLRRARELG